jgi:hypothetical protein
MKRHAKKFSKLVNFYRLQDSTKISRHLFSNLSHFFISAPTIFSEFLGKSAVVRPLKDNRLLNFLHGVSFIDQVIISIP